MARVFCLICINFDPKPWTLGYCRKKGIYKHSPYHNCAVHSLARKDQLPLNLAWLVQARDYAEKRVELMKEYIEEMGLAA